MKIPNGFLSLNSPNRLKYDKRYQVILRDGAKCNMCQHEEPENLTIDHIQAKSLGGSNEIDNLQILCKRCHHKKDKWVALRAAMLHKETNKILQRFPHLKGTLWYDELCLKIEEESQKTDFSTG